MIEHKKFKLAVVRNDVLGAMLELEAIKDWRSHNVGEVDLTLMEFVAKEGALEIAQCMLTMEPKAHAIRSRFSTPLHAAVEAESLDMVKLLVTSGASLTDSTEYSGATALHEAVTTEDLEVLQFLIDYGAEIDTLDSVGRTPLHIAVKYGKISVINTCLEAGASVNAQDSTIFHTPLHEACEIDSYEIVKVLLEAGADANSVNKKGELPSDLTDDKGIHKLLKENS